MRNASLVTLVATLLAAGCAPSAGVAGKNVYVAFVTLNGNKTAFAGRTFEAEGKPVSTAPVASVDNPDWLTVSVTLCTLNQRNFLDAPITIVVREGDAIVSTNVVQRVACRLGQEPNANLEWDTVFLEDSGVISADFGNDPRTSASCAAADWYNGSSCDDPF